MLLILVTLYPLSLLTGDLGCDDLSLCKGSASCGTPGQVVECTIYCEDGAKIECPKDGGGGGKPPIPPEL